ncbi:hypothetical protein MTBLM1_10065 [Rhodospirillaceae bacterium LM-1]|nr:hypothetical protein MTBLM1_10065 [Rhodospirillaceae bacterium LM-1]
MAIDYMGGLSILSSSNSTFSSKSMQDVIYEKITQQYKTKIEKTSQARSEVYDSRAKYYEAQNEKLSLVSGGVKNAIDTIGSAVEGAKKIKDMIFDLKIFLEKADRDPTYYAQEFDMKLTAINEEVLDRLGVYNLIGSRSRTNYEANEYDLKVDEKGTTVLLQGYNMSADYMITDSDGKYWVPDMRNSIKRYDNYDAVDLNIETTYSTAQSAAAGSGSATSKVITRTDTDYSNSAISFNVDGVDYTGTISKGGLNVGQSWIYGGFDSPEGIAQAASEVEDALENAEMMIAQLSAMQATTQGQFNVLENSIIQNKTEMTNALIAQMQEEYNFAAKIKREYEGAVTSIASIAQTQGQYTEIFGSILGDNKLMNYMFNQTV